MPSDFHEKLADIECRRDSKARRRLNDNPDVICNISADDIEKGVTLEQLDNCNTPVHCYGGQLTIHGLMPDFRPETRPNGYRSLIRNGNGSIGVKYIAVDAGKKAIIAKVCKLVDNGWHTHLNSTGFELCRNFYVKDESERAIAKTNTINAMKGIPGDKFFGSIYAYTLAYGLGYGVCADIGAIPESELWEFIRIMFGVNESELETLDNAQKEKDNAEKIAREIRWEKECAEAKVKETERIARFRLFMPTVNGTKLASIPRKTEISFQGYSSKQEIMTETIWDEEITKVIEEAKPTGQFAPKLITIKKRGFKLCYAIGKDTYPKFHQIEPRHYDIWDKACAAGQVFEA